MSPSLESLRPDGCMICGLSEEDNKKRLFIDHNHETGVVRGLLCNDCKTGLGKFKDRLYLIYRAASYLEERDG